MVSCLCYLSAVVRAKKLAHTVCYAVRIKFTLCCCLFDHISRCVFFERELLAQQR